MKVSTPTNGIHVTIDGEHLTLEDVHLVSRKYAHVGISLEAYEKIKKSREIVERFLNIGKPIYGVNTGFGALANIRISKEKLKELQRNVILSHSAGIGNYLPEDFVRAIILIRANALAKGLSGVRPMVVEKLVELLNKKITPAVPEIGSVGASGDLAPLSHIAMVLIGEGKIVRDGKAVLFNPSDYGFQPIHLEEKEGLSLINGTQFMAAHLALIVRDLERLMKIATLVAASSVDVLLGTPAAFDERIQLARPHPGQIKIAQMLREFLDGSQIRESHKNCGKVQDAYTLRTIPQVYGAVLDIIQWVKEVVQREINSATDNPLIFEDEVISGGNFHGEPLALCADYLSIALTSMGNMIERRIDRLLNPKVNEGLPPFLAGGEEGLNSGYMIWQYTAAALCNENKVLSHPASADSIPTSAYQEDHVSMGANAVRKLRKILENVVSLVSIEAMLVSVALDSRRPLRSSCKIEEFYGRIDVRLSQDRYFGDNYEKVREEILKEVFS
ncbi:histidine ammonia-lyase [Fervidobacterium pennivorans]|uniref:histidine ammonia-lyase n=1 Tax=Fervidobacterium pennivorans TaxID=93466 RepID=UPI001436BE13|nr:histidine ammonia-lyase [Fervidobacterium pennivorans]QIV77843.1 histidine ammonia-lyase [Fervidobacterium pennivorans subsp. keratinolyticus]